MEQKNSNPSIACTVSTCAYHSKDQNHCTLGTIKVGCSAPNAMNSTSTECSSFQLDGSMH